MHLALLSSLLFVASALLVNQTPRKRAAVIEHILYVLSLCGCMLLHWHLAWVFRSSSFPVLRENAVLRKRRMSMMKVAGMLMGMVGRKQTKGDQGPWRLSEPRPMASQGP